MTNEEKVEKLITSIEKINKKQNHIMFYLPVTDQVNAAVGVTYSHALKLQDLGYVVSIIHEDEKYIKPEWLGAAYCSLNHIAINSGNLKVGIHDMLVYPEGFTDIMEKTADLKCIKVILCQSHNYVLGTLTPGLNWNDYDIDSVITTQKPLKDYLEKIFGADTINVQIIPPAIDERIFKNTGKLRKPVVAISARSQQDILDIAKQFYSTYPQFRMISFTDMRGLSRTEFADVLNEAFLGVWVDRIASFGTFPIECAKTNTPFIALIPDMLPEYATDENGTWNRSKLELPDLIATRVALYLNNIDNVGSGLQELATKYTNAEEATAVEQVYTRLFSNKINELETLVNKIKNEK